jgi:hypothetical protein
MIIHDRSFPHPVLAPFRDDVSPNDFSLRVRVSPDADNFYVEAHFAYSNPTLIGLVRDGKAIHSVHLECKRNFYREIFSSKEPIQRSTIKASELVGRVEISGFIRAQLPIDGYGISGAHADYGDTKFQIRSGDILAVCPTQYFDAFVDYDPLRSISSILTIRRSEKADEGPITLETNDDKIVATLSQKDYDRYTNLKADPALGPLLANQVVVPVLLEAVHEIRDDSDEEFEEGMTKRWYRSVYKKLTDLGMDLRTKKYPALEALQVLLKLPLRRSLEGLIQMDPLDDNA